MNPDWPGNTLGTPNQADVAQERQGWHLLLDLLADHQPTADSSRFQLKLILFIGPLNGSNPYSLFYPN